MKFKVSLTIITFTITYQVFSFGWSDWESTTPGGNRGDNYSGKNIALYINNEMIDGIQKQYFYKNHIIGQIGQDQNEINAYFIVDENQSLIIQFEDKRNWESEIVNRSLAPIVWTRWFTSDWYALDDWNILMLPFFLIVILPIKVLYLYALITAIKKEKITFFKPYTTISTIITLILVFALLLEIYPQSI